MLAETWITLPPALLPAVGVLLMVAGLCLLLWSDVIVSLVILFLGVLAILLGLGFLAAGHFLGRAGIPPVLLFIAGLASILVGILAFLRRDLVADLIIYLAAGIFVLLGAFLLFIGGLLSSRGWGRRAFLWVGLALLAGGIVLAVFPGEVARAILAAGGALLIVAGAAALLVSYAGRRSSVSRL
ncbi:MAG: DUF308 domain-containing protein [Methanomicrobiales archaeon]